MGFSSVTSFQIYDEFRCRQCVYSFFFFFSAFNWALYVRMHRDRAVSDVRNHLPYFARCASIQSVDHCKFTVDSATIKSSCHSAGNRAQKFKKQRSKRSSIPNSQFISNYFQDQLSKKFKVQGIPTLVFVDGQTGKLITDSGREKVSKFPDGEGFPWHPVPLSQILTKGKLLKGSEEVDAETALTGKVKGIYFSAHWVRGFGNYFSWLLRP